jgi:hypothetical protein
MLMLSEIGRAKRKVINRLEIRCMLERRLERGLRQLVFFFILQGRQVSLYFLHEVLD